MWDTYFHLCAFFASLTNGSTNAAVAAVQDNWLTRTVANTFTMPRPMKARAAYSAGAFLQRARINTPSFRYVGLPYVGPVNQTLTVPSPPNVYDLGDNGPLIPTVDDISIEHSLLGAAPENELTLLWLQDRMVSSPGQAEYRIRYTAAIAGVTGQWASGTMTPDQTLPNGRYAVIGMDAIGTNLVGARLIFAGGGPRPGCLGRNAVNGIYNTLFTSGALGVYGTFDSLAQPNLEVFVSGANAVQEIYLDLIRIGPHSAAAYN
jgi:hypothetical protein